MDKFGVIRPGYTPPRQGEKTAEELNDTVELNLSDAVEARKAEKVKEAKEVRPSR
jgi:hypothetical protein